MTTPPSTPTPMYPLLHCDALSGSWLGIREPSRASFTTIFDDYSREWIIRYYTPDVEAPDGTSGMEWDDPVTFRNHADAVTHATAVVNPRRAACASAPPCNPAM